MNNVKKPIGPGIVVLTVLISLGWWLYSSSHKLYVEEAVKTTRDVLFETVVSPSLAIEEHYTDSNGPRPDCWLLSSHVGYIAKWEQCDSTRYYILKCTESHVMASCKIVSNPLTPIESLNTDEKKK